MTSHSLNMIRFDFFYRRETRHRTFAEHAKRAADVVSLMLPASTGLDAAISAAIAAGMPKGSQRSACFEVQTDAGIWQHRDAAIRERAYGRISSSNAIFTPWDAL